MNVYETALVKDQCDFTTRKGVRNPTYMRLAQGVYVLSDYSDLSIDCATYNESRRLDCNPCLITVGCGCRVHSASWIVIERFCPENESDSSMLYTVNLIVLQHFYDITNLTMTGKSRMTPEDRILPVGVKWEFYGEKVSKLLAADDSASYSLKKLAASLQNESQVYHTPAEALLSDIINEQALHKFFGLDLSILNAWAIAVLVFLIVVLSFFQFRTRKEMAQNSKLLAQLGVSTALLTGTRAQDVQLKTTPNTVTLPYDWNELLEYFREDMIHFVIVLIALVLIFLWTLYIMYWTTKMRSYVYIDISTDKGSHLIYYKQLPDASRCFRVVLPQKNVKLTIVNFFLFGCIKFEGKSWKLEHKSTLCRSTLPKRIWIGRSDVIKLTTLLRDPTCEIGPVVVNSHEQLRRVIYSEKNDKKVNENTNFV